MPFSLHRASGSHRAPEPHVNPTAESQNNLTPSPSAYPSQDAFEKAPKKRSHLRLWKMHFGLAPWKPVAEPAPRLQASSDVMQSVGQGSDHQKNSVPNKPIAVRQDAEEMERQGYSFVAATPIEGCSWQICLEYEKNRDVWQIVVGLSNFAQRDKITQMRHMGYRLVGSFDLDSFNTVLTFRHLPETTTHA